jgi:amino acid transporter
MVFITFQLWFWMWYPNIQLAVSRYMLAVSFDRLFPESFGKVHPKTRTPYVAILVVFVLAIIWSWIFSYPEAFRFAALVALVGIIGYAGSGLSGMILPKVRKDLFKVSPTSKHMIGSIPFISIAGAVWVIYSIICAVLFLGDPRFFLFDPASVAFFIGTYLSGIIVYYAYKAYRRRQGIDVEMAYKEIPVE